MIAASLLLASATLSDEGWGGRHVSNWELQNEKRGRVVDASSGAGIADAKVIAMWRSSSFGVGGSSSGCALQRIATTDAKGNFNIPNVANDLKLKGRGSHGITPLAGTVVDYTWNLIVFQPGYVREGDMNSFELNRTDVSRAGFAWESIPPTVSSGTKRVQVKDIRMEKADMNFERTVWYYAGLEQTTSCGRTELEQPEIEGIREAITRIVKPMPCSLPSETSVKADLAMAFSGLLRSGQFNERMRAEGQEKWPWTNTTAGALCRAAGDGNTTP